MLVKGIIRRYGQIRIFHYDIGKQTKGVCKIKKVIRIIASLMICTSIISTFSNDYVKLMRETTQFYVIAPKEDACPGQEVQPAFWDPQPDEVND